MGDWWRYRGDDRGLDVILPVKERFSQRTAFYLAEYGVCLLENSFIRGWD